MDVFGTVIDQSNKPVPYVNVAARNAQDQLTGKGTQTDINGIFDLRGINATDTVQFSAIGYRTSVPVLHAHTAANPAQNTVILEATGYDLDEAVIVGIRDTFKKYNNTIELIAWGIALIVMALAAWEIIKRI